MEEIRLAWPNGGMGNTVYCLLHLCTNELYNASVSCLIENLPTTGNHWHDVSSKIGKNKRVILDHFGYDHPQRILVGSRDKYFIILLSWYKWNGIPSVSYGEDLELLVKFLNEWQPAGGTSVDFEILNFFNNRDAIKKFILGLGLTINFNFDRVVDSIAKNNQRYYNELQLINSIVAKALAREDKKINLFPYQQAMVMSILEEHLAKPFKLVHNKFKNTKDILNFLEN